METTHLYVELIIIGLETSVWMCVIYINIVGNQIVENILKLLSNFASSLLLIGLLYILGILMDRLADMMYEKIENKIRKESGLEAKTSILIWKKYDQEKVSDYMRSRIRILRVSTLNAPLIALSFLWYVLVSVENPLFLVIYIILLGGLFTYVSWKSYIKSVKNYYNKARVIELSNK